MKTVLLIASEGEEYYFSPFVQASGEKKLRLLLLDPSWYPADATLDIHQLGDGSIEGTVEVQCLTGQLKDRISISLSEIDIAWYLREKSFHDTHEQDLPTRFAENESRQALRAMFSLMPCKWVNKSETIDLLNSNKLLQQAAARTAGLSVPQTIISNDPYSVTGFADEDEGLLLKSMGYIRLDDDGKMTLYSERFYPEELSQSHGAIRASPVFAQEYIHKRFEYRVMVIGSQVLACRIDSQASEKTKVDWRHYDFDRVEHKWVMLPEQVESKLLEFMRLVDLRFGAIDLIQTPRNDYVFLEINPSGQWGWIAEIGKVPIPQAVATMLESL